MQDVLVFMAFVGGGILLFLVSAVIEGATTPANTSKSVKYLSIALVVWLFLSMLVFMGTI